MSDQNKCERCEGLLEKNKELTDENWELTDELVKYEDMLERLPSDKQILVRQLANARFVCNEVYQAFGTLSCIAGIWGTKDTTDVLDLLSDAGSGADREYKGLGRWPTKTLEDIRTEDQRCTEKNLFREQSKKRQMTMLLEKLFDNPDLLLDNTTRRKVALLLWNDYYTGAAKMKVEKITDNCYKCTSGTFPEIEVTGSTEWEAESNLYDAIEELARRELN